MKITNEPTHVNFGEINIGDVFYIAGFGVFMKTETKGTCNAVNLFNGEFIECGVWCPVIPVNCELVIK